MIKRKNILKIAIDSPAAAGAGTLAKAISKHYNLFYLETYFQLPLEHSCLKQMKSLLGMVMLQP